MQKIETFSPTERFSDRVADYVKYRPSYPASLITTIIEKFGITRDTTIADVGSGTGIFSALLLQEGLRVIGVEPNNEMRAYAEKTHGINKGFRSICGSAENSGLESGSVDLVIVAQAFHWFNVAKTIREFDRILKKNGVILLIWNNRKIVNSAFQDNYNTLIKKHCPDYLKVNHKNRTLGRIHEFFSDRHIEELHFDNSQLFDFDSLMGRLRSSSYCPRPADPAYELLLQDVHDLFVQHQQDGMITLEYDCIMYCIHKGSSS